MDTSPVSAPKQLTRVPKIPQEKTMLHIVWAALGNRELNQRQRNNKSRLADVSFSQHEHRKWRRSNENLDRNENKFKWVVALTRNASQLNSKVHSSLSRDLIFMWNDNSQTCSLFVWLDCSAMKAVHLPCLSCSIIVSFYTILMGGDQGPRMDIMLYVHIIPNTNQSTDDDVARRELQ